MPKPKEIKGTYTNTHTYTEDVIKTTDIQTRCH